MEKIEQSLDRVCRSIGGPVALRDHVRQELRAHLLDAVAGHQAAGMTEADAIVKALEEFGKVEEVRSELEATYGQRRMMAMVIDKAMQWKEKTMKAKWLWMTWAYVAVILVIVLGILWISFANVMLVPKFQVLMRHGIIDPGVAEEAPWIISIVNTVHDVGGRYTTWWLLGVFVAVGLFERCVKSENKPWIRLSALGTVAVLLTVVSVLLAASMVIAYLLGAPAMVRMARPWAVERVEMIDAATNGLDKALAAKDWDEMDKQADQAATALNGLSIRVAIRSLAKLNDHEHERELEDRAKHADANLREMRQAISLKDAQRFHPVFAEFRKALEPIRAAATKKPAP